MRCLKNAFIKVGVTRESFDRIHHSPQVCLLHERII